MLLNYGYKDSEGSIMATSQHRKVRLTTEEFIARARAVHGEAYDYSKVVYTTAEPPRSRLSVPSTVSCCTQ